MNIQVQTCGLIVITLLMIFYKSQKTLKLYQERLFQIVLIAALAALATDVLSIVAIHYRAHLNIHFVNAVCKAYLISMLLSSFCALFYVLVGIVPEKKALEIALHRLRFAGCRNAGDHFQPDLDL